MAAANSLDSVRMVPSDWELSSQAMRGLSRREGTPCKQTAQARFRYFPPQNGQPSMLLLLWHYLQGVPMRAPGFSWMIPPRNPLLQLYAYSIESISYNKSAGRREKWEGAPAKALVCRNPGMV